MLKLSESEHTHKKLHDVDVPHRFIAAILYAVLWRPRDSEAAQTVQDADCGCTYDSARAALSVLASRADECARTSEENLAMKVARRTALRVEIDNRGTCWTGSRTLTQYSLRT